MVTVCWFSSFRRKFDSVKRVIFGFSGYFLENAWGEWPEDLDYGPTFGANLT